jgi:hypothetical protein
MHLNVRNVITLLNEASTRRKDTVYRTAALWSLDLLNLALNKWAVGFWSCFASGEVAMVSS